MISIFSSDFYISITRAWKSFAYKRTNIYPDTHVHSHEYTHKYSQTTLFHIHMYTHKHTQSWNAVFQYSHSFLCHSYVENGSYTLFFSLEWTLFSITLSVMTITLSASPSQYYVFSPFRFFNASFSLTVRQFYL